MSSSPPRGRRSPRRRRGRPHRQPLGHPPRRPPADRARAGGRGRAPARARERSECRPGVTRRAASRADLIVAPRTTRLSTASRRTGTRAASAGACSAASAIRAAISFTGKPSPARHSTTNGVRTNGRVHSACGQSWTSTTGTPSRSPARTTATSSSLGSPAITRTTTSAPATLVPSRVETVPGAAPEPSSRTSCSASMPLTTIPPDGVTGSSRSVLQSFRPSSSPWRAPAAAAFTGAGAPRVGRARGSPGALRSGAGSRPSTSRRR